MINIRDIAKLSGVSVSTVSRVINKHPHVSPKTRETVLKVMEEHNYSVNRNAVKLSTGKTHTVGVIVPTVNHETYDTILQGILTEANKYDYKIMLLISNYSAEREVNFLNLLRDKELDALIFVSKIVDDEVLVQYSHYGTIANCKRNQLPNIRNVHPKRLESYLDIYNIFKKEDCFPVFVLVPKKRNISQSTTEKCIAYEDILSVSVDPYLNTQIFNYMDGYDYAEEIFKHKGNKKLGIHVNSDKIAAGVIQYASENNFILHEDYIIISEGNTLAGGLLGITSIEYQLPLLGEVLFKSLFDEKYNNYAIDYFI